MKNIAVYAGTFDPITYGHIDVIERAAKIFEQVIIAVAANPKKDPLFTLNERMDLASNVLKSIDNVTVSGFDGLLIDFVKNSDANVILRGLRTVTDFDYEFQLGSMNRHLNPTIESIFLMPAEKYMSISSSLVKEIAAFGGNVSDFVPSSVALAFQKKLEVGDGCL